MLAPKQGDADFVKILDFGLAKLAPERLDDLEGELPGPGITRHGSVFGTPRYMAPEQCVGDEVDGRVDLYALGLILYEALSGLHPFDERDPRRMIKHQLFTPVPAIRVRAPGVNIPASLEALVMRAVEKPRGRRYSNATELLAQLAEVCEREGILPPEPSARFPTPRLLTPASSAGERTPGPSPRELASDVMATQDDPGAATADLDPEVSTQNLSDAAVTQDVSGPQPTLDLLPKTPDLLSVAVTKPLALPAPTADVPTPKPAPFRVDSIPTQPPSSAPRDPGKRATTGKRPLLLLLLVPIGFLLVCLALFSLRPRSASPPHLQRGPGSPGAAREHPLAVVGAPTTLAPAAELSRATAAGSAALLQLVQTYPTDAQVSRALAQTYVAQGGGREALHFQAKALALTENSIYDGEIMQAATLAINDPESAEFAIALLTREFGTRGMDVLIALMSKLGPGRAKSLIAQSLTKPEARTHASSAALVALDLNQASGCEAKRGLLSRAARDGDQRTLQQLKALVATRGCGMLHRSDCWPCLHKDGALRSAIAAITARASLAR